MRNWSHKACIAVFACLILPLEPAVALEEEKITLRFLLVPRAKDPTPVRLSLGEGKSLEIEAPTNTLSRPYAVDARSEWTIIGEVEGEGGETKFEKLGSAPALASPEQIILLVRMGDEGTDGLSVIPIDCRESEFGPGTMVFANATEHEFGGDVGGHGFSVEPGQYSTTRPKPQSEKSKLCNGTLFYTKEGREKPFLSTKWPLSDRARGLIVVYHDLRTSRIRLHSIRDFL